MAATYKDNGGSVNSQNLIFTYDFPVLQTEDIKVSLNGVTQDTTKYTATTDPARITFNTTSPTAGLQVESGTYQGAPVTGVTVRVYRETTVGKDDGNENPKAVFAAGSSIRAGDLNANIEQALFGIHELQNQPIQTEQLADGAIKTTIIDDAVINSQHYVALSIDRQHLANDVVDGTKIADNSIDSEHYVDDSIDTAHYAPNSVDTTALAADSVTGAELVDDAVNTEHYTNASIEHVHLKNDIIDGDNIQDDVVDSEHIVASALDNEHYSAGSITSDKLNAATVVTNSEQAAASANDTSFFTTSASDARYFNVSTGDTIKDGDTFPDNDTTIATTAAINDRIIDLVDDVGGFVPIANETSFPNANPDVNNGAGTLVSIKALASNLTSNGSGVATIANGTVGNSTVTINGLANSTTYAATFGMIVETTTTLNTYTFHRQVPKATEVTTVAGSVSNVNTVAGNISNVNTVAGISANVTSVSGNATNINTVAGVSTDVTTVASNITDVSNFADLYQIQTSAPSQDGGGNSLAAGDLWFDSSSNKVLKVHDGSAFQSVSPSQSVLNDIANVSGQLTYSEDLGTIVEALTTETGNNINTVATNINNINNFSDQYKVESSQPSGASAGDLWYDTTGNVLKYHNGSAFVVTASAGMSEVIDDTTPELGGHLDCNDKNLTEVGTVSGTNLQIDFGTLT